MFLQIQVIQHKDSKQEKLVQKAAILVDTNPKNSSGV